MNWLDDYVRPTLKTLGMGGGKEVPDNLWTQCPSCQKMMFKKQLDEALHVCQHCGHHLRVPVDIRLASLFDDTGYEVLPTPTVTPDPLKFKAKKAYAQQIKENSRRSGTQEAIVVANGEIGGNSALAAVFNGEFIGGSMGRAVGEAFVQACQRAVQQNAGFIVFTNSGGARMQEGALSLMQMPRTTIGVQMLREAGLPYIVVMTNPTYGGVTASLAMLGDIHLAEPGAMIGFAGRRVIEDTIREKLPDDFQTAESNHKFGLIDQVVSRSEMRDRLISLLGYMMPPKQDGGSHDAATVQSSELAPASANELGSKS